MPAPLPARAPAEKPKAQVSVPHSGPVAYSVQVGAFREKRQCEIKAQMLRSKGFESRIDPPQNSEDLYLLKVGTFHSRAEAVAMQLQLKKAAFLAL